MSEYLGHVDVAVIGGGIMGSLSALFLARRGLKVALIERGNLCTQASGRNAGTLAVQYPRAQVVHLALQAREMWERSSEWLGVDTHYRMTGGLSLAFNDAEAEQLERQSAPKRDAGCPIEIIGRDRARDLEPGITTRVVAAAWCPIDGYGDPTALSFGAYRSLAAEHVMLLDRTPVQALERSGTGFTVSMPGRRLGATRLLVASGVWNGQVAKLLGVDLPVGHRVNQMIVTERTGPIFTRVLGVVTGRLSLKRKPNGTVLIGGGWEGVGHPDTGGMRVVPDNMIGNLRLAQFAIPELAKARVVRTWFGVRDHLPDYMPLAGQLPGLPGAYILSCGVSGFTVGPALAKTFAEGLADERDPFPQWDPGRFPQPVRVQL